MKLNPFAMMKKEFDGTGIVFDPENNKAMALNDTGVVVWEALEANLEIAQIIQKLMEHFEVEESAAKRDIEEFISVLKEKGLLADE